MSTDAHVSYQKFNCFVQDQANKKHNFSSDVFKVMFTNVAPVATNTVIANITEIAPQPGYSAGGPTLSISESLVAGVLTVLATRLFVTPTSVALGPFRYVVLYNATAAGGPLVGYWDFGVSITLGVAKAFSMIFDAVNGMFRSQ